MSESNNTTKEQRHKLITNCLQAMATALQLPISSARIQLYCIGLDDLTSTQLAFGFKETVRGLENYIPSIATIRGHAESWRAESEDAAKTILRLPDKPDDATPETRREYSARLIAEMRQKIKDGYYSMPDPTKEPMLTYQEQAEKLAAERNGPSKVPKDPDERKTWATDTAKKQGWLR